MPPAFDGFRVGFVTDIHCGAFFSPERVGGIVDRVNGLGVDVVLLGGDYVHNDTDNAAPCFKELARLQAPSGVFAVLGNHDYGEHDDDADGPARVLEAAAEAAIPVLVNEGVWIERDGERLRLAGADDYSQGSPRIAPTIAGTTAQDFVLLVSHNPDLSERLPKDRVDLVLAGHTHGGQVTIFGLWAPHIPSQYGQKYRTGVVTNRVTTVIVSNGVGTSTFLPIRLLARPQIVVVTLRSGSSAIVQP
ncbi:MAG: metallophosphoesterase [Thermoleophilia bacterium]|nr:metallophosphoesterase [Thermoleophilia bacterium]